jgi:pilus assembly protein Flp/PilA
MTRSRRARIFEGKKGLKMMSLRNSTTEFLADESGATSIEYAIMAAGIAVAIVTAVQAVGTKVNALFTSVQTAFR